MVSKERSKMDKKTLSILVVFIIYINNYCKISFLINNENNNNNNNNINCNKCCCFLFSYSSYHYYYFYFNQYEHVTITKSFLFK